MEKMEVTKWYHLPLGCIVLVDFKLNDNNKLSNETYKYLKEAYKKLQENN